MIIKRTFKDQYGNDISLEFKLTSSEIWEAYRECLLSSDIDDVKWAIENRIADASDDAEEAIFREMLDDKELIEELATKARDRIDDADEWQSGTAYTFADIVQDAYEDIEAERNAELGWC